MVGPERSIMFVVYFILTLLPECQSEIIQLHPDLTSCDLSIKK